MLSQLKALNIEFSIKGKNYIIGKVYELFLRNILCEVVSIFETPMVLILGDYNRDLLKLNRKKIYSKYFAMMSYFGYRTTIFRPTRVTASLPILSQQKIKYGVKITKI